jgi:hypothetical protein
MPSLMWWGGRGGPRQASYQLTASPFLREVQHTNLLLKMHIINDNQFKNLLRARHGSFLWRTIPLGPVSAWELFCVRLGDKLVSKVSFYLNSFMVFIKLCWGLNHSGTNPIKIAAANARTRTQSHRHLDRNGSWEEPFITFSKVAGSNKPGGRSLNLIQEMDMFRSWL